MSNAKWSVEIEPSTLAIRVIPMGEKALDISTGGAAHVVSELKENASYASWQWDQSLWHISVSLIGYDLAFSIKARTESSLTLVDQPASAAGRALLVPLAEGSYIPTGDKIWQSFLVNKRRVLENPAEEMTLPLWGIDHGRFSLHWIWQNPFDNRLSFRHDKEGVGLTLIHHFSQLRWSRPMTWMLHLSPSTDLLAGAKRYRQWLMAQQRWQSLDAKAASQPQIARLFGASHLYLWGNGPLAMDNIRDWAGLLRRLRANTPLASDVRRRIDAESRAILDSHIQPNRYQKKRLIDEVNQAIEARVREQWQVSEPDWRALPGRYHQQRIALQAWLGPVLAQEVANGGGGLSSKMLATFARMGLKKLWLGLGEGWEGGLWHPEAVRQAVAAGYVVAPYDSYETGLPLGDNPAWSTAHLGVAAWRDCAVMKPDGSLLAGFQNSGHYLNPVCTRPILQQRLSALRKATAFNGWFLDAYGTGMAWDDARPGKRLSAADMVEAYSDSMSWVAHQLDLLIGSEGGNAVANRGMVLGHGIGMPAISWLDADFNKQSSPWYLGRWFPNDQPEVFFKTMALKEPYRRLYHDPVYRLPLYQAVFHDSVITTSHWLYDNMKFSNTRQWDTMVQLLYNTPPLYHLNMATLTQRLPVILRHDQFFRPLHQRLARQALTNFRWLSVDHRVQQTTFADNTRLTANGSDQPVKVNGIDLASGTVLAEIPGQAPLLFAVSK